MRRSFREIVARPRWGFAAVALSAICLAASPAQARGVLRWDAARNLVSADIRSEDLSPLLRQISAATGWQVYLEPDAAHQASAKFSNLPPGDALRLLLGHLNFALVPDTNGPARLYVFRTSQGNATRLVRGLEFGPGKRTARVIPNELIVRLKPGANIDELAAKLGAKVVGRIPGLNLYRLQFPDQAAADAALAVLKDNPEVAGVDYNYVVKPPPAPLRVAAANMAPIQLKLNPPPGSGRVVVGLVDTAVQPLGDNLDSFLSKSLSVAGQANLDPNSPSHGTAMYESILRAAAAAGGGSTSMQVVSVDVYGPNPTTSSFYVAEGIAAAVNNGANVINLSLGSPDSSPALEYVIEQAAAQGVLFIGAQGNDGSSEPFYPADYPNVTSVTASSGNGQLASYANYGPSVDLMAPGSAVIYYNGTPYLVTGTSTSTALVSGTLAGTATAQRLPLVDVLNQMQNSPVFRFTPKANPGN